MRLLLISQDFPPSLGGIQTYTYELAKRLCVNCDSFAVVAPWEEGCETFDASVPFDVIRLRTSIALFPFRLISVIRKFEREHGLDLVFNVQWPSAIGSYLTRRTGVSFRTAIAAHGREILLKPFNFSVLNRFQQWVLGKTLLDAKVILPVSKYTSSLLSDFGIDSDKIQIINNGADVEHFRQLGTNGSVGRPKTILTVSRLVPRKGIDTVLRSLPAVTQEIPNLEYIVAGDGPDMERLASLAKDLNVEAFVRFLGSVPYKDLPELYNHCDVFVMPSRDTPPDVEGFGIVFLEANACGKPVIGARSGGIPDAIQHRQTGLLVDPDNDKQLAAAIVETLRDKDLAATLGQNGLERVRSSGTWDHVADRVISVFNKLIVT